MTKIYLDNCCLCRIFDDQSQKRIKLETDVIELILVEIQEAKYHWFSSDILRTEIMANNQIEKRDDLLKVISYANLDIKLNDSIIQRHEELKRFGFSPFDAFHLASAEYGKADILLTTDDNFIKLYERESPKITVKVENPLSWFQRELL